MNANNKLVPPGMVHVTRVHLVRGQSAALAVSGEAATDLDLLVVGPDGRADRSRAGQAADGFTARTTGMHLLRVVNASLRSHRFGLRIAAPRRQSAMAAI